MTNLTAGRMGGAMAALALGAVALTQPVGATDFTFSGANWSSWTTAGNWTPAIGAPPRNGDIGIVTNSKIVNADGNLFSGSDTAPLEVRVSSSGVLYMSVDTLADHNIVLDGGSFGGWWNSCTYTNKVSVRSVSYLGNANNDNVNFRGVIQNDGANSAELRVAAAGSPSTVYLRTNNTWTGGLRVDGGTLYASASNAVGTGSATVNGGTLYASVSNSLGTGPATVNGGTLELDANNPAATVTLNAGGTLTVAASHAGPLVLNGGTVNGSWNGIWTLSGGVKVHAATTLVKGNQATLTYSGLIQDDGANTGTLITTNNGVWGYVYLTGTNNTWTGGVRVDNTSRLYAGASNCVGSGAVTVNGGNSYGLTATAPGCLGACTVTVNASSARLQADSPAATIWVNTNGAVSIEANHGGTFVLNGGKIACQAWQVRDKTFYGNIRVRADSIVGTGGNQEYTLLGGLIQDDGLNTGTLIVSNGASERVYINGTNNTWTGGLLLNSANAACYVSATNTLGTGPVTVNGGTLYVQGRSTIADTATLRINSPGVVNLAAGVNETVQTLVLDGVTNNTYGTWGATGSSPAPSHTNNTRLAGTGILTVTGPPQPPSVDNDGGALNTDLGTASLRGNLGGNAAATVTIYWGLTDGSNNPTAWATNAVLPNTPVGSFSTTAGGLLYGSNYYYTCYATNANGTNWAPASTNFVTLVPQPFYVKPGGTGSGTSWDDALGNIQTAINLASNIGSCIYLKDGAYSNTTSLIISNVPGVRVYGGYAGSGSPGDTNGLPSVLTRSVATSNRIVYGYASTVTLARVTIQGGLRPNDGDQGGGLYLNNCAATLQDCTVVSNVVSYDVAAYTGTGYGGGLYATGGRLSANNTLFRGNYVTTRNNSYGGGAYCTSVALALTNCTFDGNYVQENNVNVQGGGLYLSGGSASLTACVVSNNWVNKRYSHNADPAGGGVWANNVNPLTMVGCTFVTNRIVGSNADTSTKRKGAPLYLTGASLSAVLQDCVFNGNGVSSDPAGELWVDGGAVVMRGCTVMRSVNDGLRVAGGTVGITNCLAAKNGTNGVYASAGTVSMANCTLADNGQYGLNNAGTANVKNTIAWGNGSGGINGATSVNYSDAQGSALPGNGNLNSDPSFVNAAAGDYHEKSKSGSWHNDANDWVTDTVHSVCIDMGDPADPYTLEPVPNGVRINMGAYGGTVYASKTYAGAVDTLAAVTNLGATAVRRQSAVLWGRLVDPGTESGLCSTWFYYWPSGGATNVAPMGLQNTNAAFSTTLSGLLGGTPYAYQVLASNQAGAAWSDAKNFTTLSGSASGFYVAPDGDGSVGTNWSTAFTNVQDGVNESQVAGDVIFVKSGIYSNASQVTVTNQPGLTIRGGYAGNEVGGLPGETNSAPSVITRNAANNIRIVYGYASTVTVDRITVQGGYTLNASYGAGLMLTNCNTTITNCTITGNVLADGDGQDKYGGGIYVANGSLRISSSLLSSNRAEAGLGQNYKPAAGGALACLNASVTLADCRFEGNSAKRIPHYPSLWGGALYMSGGSLSANRCTFTNNFLDNVNGNATEKRGGAVYLTGVNPAGFDGTTFVNNRIDGPEDQWGNYKYGMAAYLVGSAVRFSTCTFYANASTVETTPAKNFYAIYLPSGTLAMTNCLLARTAGTGGLYVNGGAAGVMSCTLADNADWGIKCVSGSVTTKNCIVWGNTVGQLSGVTTTTWSDVQGTLLPGDGNDNTDPSFVNAAAGDYHEKSKAGSWHNDVSGWVTDTVHSVCIDKGDPSDPVGPEPAPNGGKINMGAYGGTAYASKTYVSSDTQASVTNLGATLVRRQSARLWGQVLVSGTESGLLPTWLFYWPNEGATNTVAMGNQTTNAPFYWDVSGLSGGSTYSYQVLGSNAAGAAWSDVTTFSTLGSQATNWYVALSGAGTPGTDWVTAFTNLQDAVNEGVANGDVIYVKSGVYSNTSTVTMANRPGLTVRGGYTGDEIGGLPGSTSSVPAVLTRNTASTIRILSASASTATLERVTISGGYPLFADQVSLYGAGLFATNCDLTLRSCVVSNNSFSDSDIFARCGAGIYATLGTLRVQDSVFDSNTVQMKGSDSATRGPGAGGAIAGSGAQIILSNSIFRGNSARMTSGNRGNLMGGSVYCSGGQLTVFGCTFTNSLLSVGGDGASKQGGAICVSGASSAVLDSTSFNNSRIDGNEDLWGVYKFGTAVYLEGTPSRITGCTFYTNSNTGVATPTPEKNLGVISSASSSLAMTNCLVAQSIGAHGLWIGAVTASVVNCTLADSTMWGLTNASGTVAVKNSIVWGNALGGLCNATTTSYSDVQGGVPAGTGNISSDPLFVNAAGGDYHEKGTGGSWHNGAWTRDPVDSPCLDKGDPASPYTLEPYPNGRRVNMGAYGNTPQASKVYVAKGSMFTIY